MNNESKISNQGVTSILDSNPIVATKRVYDFKLVDCGEIVQVYYYEDRKTKKNEENATTDLEYKEYKMDKMFEKQKNSKKKSELSNVISEKHILRSKVECQRLAKANMKDWKTFITLTFEENIKDVEYANKRFKYFIDKARRLKCDLKYLCITEFQKRGATHYHMLCNIDINDTKLIYSQKDNPKFKHIKFWIDGFTSVEKMTGDTKKVIGYIAKYMSKDIDNRLFNRHRYFYSRNLNKPIENYIDSTQIKEKEFFEKKIQDKELVFQSSYVNPYDQTNVIFLEFRTNNKIVHQ